MILDRMLKPPQSRLLSTPQLILPILLQPIKLLKKRCKRINQKTSGRRVCLRRELSRMWRLWSTRLIAKFRRIKCRCRQIPRCSQRLRSQFQKNYQPSRKFRRKLINQKRRIRQWKHKLIKLRLLMKLPRLTKQLM